MIRRLIIISVIFIALIFGLSIYLQSDDLSKCGDKPSLSVGCQTVDAIVAVSGGDTNARTVEAINLYKTGWSKKLIFSGAAQDKTGPSNAAVMKSIALSSGIPADAIYLDEYSETTKQNALNSQTIFADLKIKSIVLVTSGYHQRRAGLEFKKRANDVTVYNHPAANDKGWSWFWWLTPGGWWLAGGEVIKIVIFYMAGNFG